MTGHRSAFALIVEDDEAFARNLRSLLRLNWHLDAKVASTVAAAHALVDQGVRPRIFLLDIGLPDGDGMSLAESLRPKFPDSVFAILTAHESRELLARALRLGAQYVVKPCAVADIGLLVERALARPGLAERLHAAISALALRHHLTSRERQLLALKLGHYSNSQIATEWGVELSTVESTARSVLCKTGATGESNLAGLAHQVWLMARGGEADDETRRDETRRDETRRDETRRASSAPATGGSMTVASY